MKKSELRKIVIEYKEIKIKLSKSSNKKLKEELKQLEHRYYHETGRALKLDFRRDYIK
jgi:hypothetical protein